MIRAAVPAAILALLAAGLASAQPAPSRCIVDWVADGDSLRCADGEQVRLLLIDSPERDQGVPAETARAFATRLMPRGTVLGLETDVEPRDSHGRVLAYAWLPDGRMVNEEMARAGHALYYEFRGRNMRYADRIAAAEEAAQRARSGFWKDGGVRCPPQQFRHGKCKGFH